jgi:glyoxalase family protein
MRRRILVQALLSMGLLTAFIILTAHRAYADNCGSLSDCFPTAGSAASVIAGVAVIITIAVLALPSLLATTKSTTPSQESDTVPRSQPSPALLERDLEDDEPDSEEQDERDREQRTEPDSEHPGERHREQRTGPHPEHRGEHHREQRTEPHPEHRGEHHLELPDEPQEPIVEPSRSLLQSIHHVTAIAGNPQQNIDFYTGLLGLRLVKFTVNFDNPHTYHLYYGDELGRPGSILSFFTRPGVLRGSRGSGQAVAVSFSIPEGTLNRWTEYLSGRGIRVVQPPARFDEQMFSFYDPDGLQIDMVAHRDTGMYPARSGGPVPPAYAIRGIYSVTLLEANIERTHAFLTEVLGFHQVKAVGNRFRYEVGYGGPETLLDVLSFPKIPPSQVTVGTIHHVAWRTPGDEQQLALQQQLTSGGFNLTQGIDRLYFPSYFFHEPGGVLFEIAMDGPGFTIDEPPERLGTHLALPPWLEPRRSELEQVLPPLRLPLTGR